MEPIAIAALTPELPALESKQFTAVVTLIWPYSSSARQFALLLGEPDFRLRRKNGQVRVRFSGSSARAIATTGVGIGDEVALSLRGAEFMREGSVNTPGKSIDWELSYTQTLSAQVLRNGNKIASLDLDNVAPTPTPRSPVRSPPPAILEGPQKWASPAFLKRTRLSEGPVFEAGYDPFTDDTDDRHDMKRRRKSYRDWNAWTYSARTPSPEKEDAGAENDDIIDGSPVRPTKLPGTPLSPPKPDRVSVAGLPLNQREDFVSVDKNLLEPAVVVENGVNGGFEPVTKESKDDFVRDADYYDLYAGPNELAPLDGQYTFDGDTEPDTEDGGEAPAAEDARYISLVDAESLDSDNDTPEPPHSDLVNLVSDDDISAIAEVGIIASAEQDNIEEVNKATGDDMAFLEYEQSVHERSGTHEDRLVLDGKPQIVMPPPTLPLLQTDFSIISAPGFLTPIGKEPSSPTLLPLDSSTLPMPSPFPGERDGTALSYLELPISTGTISNTDVSQQEQRSDNDTEYIIESSFYSSVSASNAPAFHPTHESAFTDVRFTFGIDGSTLSRPAPPSKEEESLDVSMEWNESVHVVEAISGIPQDQQHALDEVNEYVVNDTVPSEQQKDISMDLLSPTTENHILPELLEDDVIVLSSSSESGDTNEDSQEPAYESDAQDIVSGSFNDAPPGTQTVMEHVKEAETDEQMARLPETEIPHHLGMEDINIRIEGQEKAQSASSGRFATATQVINLGSPSEGVDNAESIDDEAPNAVVRSDLFKSDERIAEVSAPGNRIEPLPSLDIQESASHEEQSNEYLDGETVLGEHTFIDNQLGEPTHVIAHQSGSREELREESEQNIVDDVPQLALGESHEPMPSPITRQDELMDAPDAPLDNHPDIKMESIEEDASFNWTQGQGTRTQDDDEESINDPSAELLIAVPDDGHKIGEMKIKSVPASAPAKNTRSQTKTSMSPAKDETPAPQRATRSKKPKPSITPIVRTNLSPFATRSISATSPRQDTMATSPYSLRSQSKLRSPTKSTTPTAEQERPRKRSTKRSSVEVYTPSKDTFIESTSFHSEDLELPSTSFGPSQELGTSQSRFSNVSYIKDSEEGSLQSENSLSTVQYSDYWNMGTQTYTNVNDQVEPNPQIRDTVSSPPRLQPTERSSSPTVSSALGAEARSKRDPRIVKPTKKTPPEPLRSFSTQPAQSSPGRSRYSLTPTEVTSTSPRRSRRLQKDVYDKLPDANVQQAAGTADNVEYPVLPLKGEGSQLPSSPPAPLLAEASAASDSTERPPSSPPTAQAKFSSNQQSLANSNMPITPEATQQTFAESQNSPVTNQLEQTLPMTPQLTQTTSARLGSFNTDVEMEEVGTEPLVKPSLVNKTTSRRNISAGDVAPQDASLSVHSADVSNSEDELVPNAKTELPSIGLSTPVAYYTPLKDLTFFLNRSSQFHSATSPDILALVTSATTLPKRATSGPKHHATTLHITDLSIYPSTTTVQIFRAYANALPTAENGDVILLRAFTVKSLNRRPSLVSGDESAWCVWRYSRLLWGRKRGAFAEVRAREEVNGPEVERGEGEWREVEKLREWYISSVKKELEEKEEGAIKTRSKDKGKAKVTNGVEGADGG